MNDTLIQYVYKGQRRVGCVVAVGSCVAGGKKVITFGWSKCLVKPTKTERMFNGHLNIQPDRFNKYLAITIAKNRALKGCLIFEQAVNANKVTYPDIPSEIRPYLRNMAQRARRYFRLDSVEMSFSGFG